MSIGLGAHTSISVNPAAAAAQSTSGITTTSGSTVVALVSYAGTWSGFSDSKSNTWTQIGTEISFGGLLARAFRCVNITGGAGHTFTATLTASGNPVAIWVVEATGAAAASIDQENISADSTTPFDSPAVTTTQAAEMLISILAEDANTGFNYTHTCGNSFTALTADEVTDASFITGISSYRIVAATGTYNASVTVSPSGTVSTASVIVAIKEAGGGGGGGGSDAQMGGRISRTPIRPRAFAPGVAR